MQRFIIHPGDKKNAIEVKPGVADDDAAEAADDRYSKPDARDARDRGQGKKKGKGGKKETGQNTSRKFGTSHDALRLCNSRAFSNEFSPKECRFGDKCKLEHDLRKYLKEGRREDLTTFNGKCPVYEVQGFCNMVSRSRCPLIAYLDVNSNVGMEVQIPL